MSGFRAKVSFMWSLVEFIRGDYNAAKFGRVILALAFCGTLIAYWNERRDLF